MSKEFQPSDNYVQEVFKHFSEFYSSRSKEEQENILKSYYFNDEKAGGNSRMNKLPVFEDPPMRVFGFSSFRVQFVSLIKFFDKIDIQFIPLKTDEKAEALSADQVKASKNVNYEVIDPGEKIFGEPTVDIRFKTKQTYTPYPNSWLMKNPIVLPSVLTILSVSSKDGRILKHRDMWEGTKESWFHRKIGKRIIGSVTSTIFKVLRW